MKAIIPILLILLITPFRAEAEDIKKNGETLSLEQCIEIALSRQPSIIAASNAVKINQSKIGEAQANYYPQIDWISGYSKISTASGASGSAGTVSSSRLSSENRAVDQYSNSITLKQNIFDFGKTSTQVKIQNLNLDSSRADFENVKEQTILNVKQSYYGALQAKKNRDVAEESIRQFDKHMEQAKGFYQAGTKPKIDVTKAEVDLSNSRLNLIKAENALRIAFATLNNAMGIPEAPEYNIEDNLSFQRFGITFEEALERAYNNRPDLLSLTFKRQAADNSISLAKTGYFPVLSGNATYNWTGQKFPLEEGWNAGVSLSFPLFSGFQTKYQTEEFKSNLNVLKSNEESLRQNIFLEVQQLYLNLKDAEERIPVSEIVVKQAEENLELANGRYEAGVGNPIEVTDAQVGLSNAKVSHIQALYDYKVAQASLEKAMGVK